MPQEKDSEGKFSGLRRRAEETLSRKPSDKEDIAALSPEEVQRLVHELRVHQIELEMQNEDLRQAQVKLEELKDRYLDLYDFAPVGYVTLNDKGLILEANLTMVRLLGVERQGLIKRPFSRFVCQEFGDAYYLYLQKVFETQSEQTCEIKLAGEDGTHFYAQLESIAVQDENTKCSRCRTIVSDITQRKQYQEKLGESIRQKELLLREIHHRVKNNLQIMSSILALQAHFAGNETGVELLKEAEARVRSMALVHEQLYQSETLSSINLQEYFESLASYLLAAWHDSGAEVLLRQEIEPIMLDPDTVLALGFIFTELFSNCLKHAFADGRKGEIIARFQRSEESAFTLDIEDNGMGIPQQVDLQKPTTLGLELVNLFVKQLRGRIEVVSDNGSRWHMTFHEAEKRKELLSL